MTLVIAASPRDRDGRQAALGAGALHRATDRLADRFRVHDGLFVDGVVRGGLRRIRLNAVLATRHGELDELHREVVMSSPNSGRYLLPSDHTRIFLFRSIPWRSKLVHEISYAKQT